MVVVGLLRVRCWRHEYIGGGDVGGSDSSVSGVCGGSGGGSGVGGHHHHIHQHPSHCKLTSSLISG